MKNGIKYALLVEDEMLVAMFAADALRELGFAVKETASANAALKAAKAEIGEFDLAVVDLGLPDRPGDEVVAELKAMRPDLPVIVASGHSSSEQTSKFKVFAKVAILPKPYIFGSLEASIKSLGA